jgi:hypothetical protein
MKHALLVGILAGLLGMVSPLGLSTVVSAQRGDANALGAATLHKAVMINGQKVPAGTYQIRLTNETPKPGAGQSPDAERFVEFLRGGKVVAREVATVVSEADLKEILDSPRRPAAGTARVETLKGDDYVRVWLNKGGTNYIIHLPTAA